MLKIICDRCGKEIPPGEEKGKFSFCTDDRGFVGNNTEKHYFAFLKVTIHFEWVHPEQRYRANYDGVNTHICERCKVQMLMDVAIKTVRKFKEQEKAKATEPEAVSDDA